MFIIYRPIITAANWSVLNTDAFDKRRFKEIYSMSQRLREINDQSSLPMFEHLLADIWASLFKMKPEIIVEDIDEVLKVNKALMQRIMAQEYFQIYRNFTRLDDLTSAIGAMKFGEMVNKWLDDQQKKDQEFQFQIDEIRAKQSRLQFHSVNEKSQEIKANFTQAIEELNDRLQRIIQDDSDTLREAMTEAMQESKQLKEDLKSLLGGSSAGNGNVELKKVPLREQILLAEKIASDKQMKKIAEWAGRFKQIARNKQKSKHTKSVERRGIVLGGNIERLLPIELGYYTHQITKNDFLRRLVEGQTMQYEQKGREVLGKGPIILCLDQSDSMSCIDTQSKGFALALLSIARMQRRDFCLLVFSTRTQIFIYEKGRIKASELLRLARTFLGGGTNIALALEGAMNVINENRFKYADLIVITDGEDQLSEAFLEAFNKKKQEKTFHVLSLVIGSTTDTVKPFADSVVQVTDLNAEGSFTAFEV